MITLAIDTSAHLCAAALHDTGRDRILAERTEDIGRGHAERLMDVIGEVLARAGLGYPALDRVAASAGPGSFTGVRVGLATARGIALGRAIPAVGISTLQALRAVAVEDRPGGWDDALLALIDARRGEAYAQFFAAGDDRLPAQPFVADYGRIAAMAAGAERLALCGSGAPVLMERAGLPASLRDATVLHELAAAPIAHYARIGSSAEPHDMRPEPLYMRPPDAKPQAGFAVART